jgi:hypothetical protein
MGLNPYLFIVGCPRSGTTLLRRMIDAHEDIAVTRETHWIPDVYRQAQDAGHAATAALLTAHPKFATLGIDRDEVDRVVEASRTYAEVVSQLFDRYAASKAKPLAADKTPGYVRELPLLHELFPAARFVHLVRDGRDVCLSALDWDRRTVRRLPTWDTAPVATAALWWRWHVLLGRRAGRRLGDARYHEVRYEALVIDPEGTLRRLCEFLGVRFDLSMLSFHEGRTRFEPGISAKRAWLPPTTGLRVWGDEMPPEQLEEFEAAAGDALEELGYHRAVPAPAAGTLARAAAVAAAFPGRPLPEGW